MFASGLEELLAEHIEPVTGGFLCRICAKVLKGRKDNVRSHYMDLHWADAPSYVCYGNLPSCQRVFTSRNNFKVHLSKYHRDAKGIPLKNFIKSPVPQAKF